MAFDAPEAPEGPEPSGDLTGSGSGFDSSGGDLPPGGPSDPALGLVRSMTMSSDKELLRQLRDAMNPKQKEQTRLMLFQFAMCVPAPPQLPRLGHDETARGARPGTDRGPAGAAGSWRC